MDIGNEIKEYLNCKETIGALLVTGAWGCGKSYNVKKIVAELNANKDKNNKYAIAVISLFGVNSVEEINNRVKDEYISFCLGGSGRKKIVKKITGILKDALKIANENIDNKTINLISSGLSFLEANGILNLLKVDNKITNADGHDSTFALVFDDFERCSIDLTERLGVINEYLENRKIKVIIIADETKIVNDEKNKEKYREFKEKLIYNTIKIEKSDDEIAESIITSFDTNNKGYKKFLDNNKDLIIRVHNESGYNNFRTLKACLVNFERIYKLWIDNEFPQEDIPKYLYRYCALLYEYKAGKYGATDDNYFGRIYNFISDKKTKEEKDNEIKQIEQKYKGGLYLIEQWMSKWIVDGIWEENDITDYNVNIFEKKKNGSKTEFLYNPIYKYSQQEIENTLPEIIGKAYSGQLSNYELILLLRFVHSAKECNIDVDVDYSEIEKMLDKKINEIKERKIECDYPKMPLFRDVIDDESISVYNKILNMPKIVEALKNKDALLKYFNSNSGSLPMIKIEIIEFDDELLHSFIDNYEKSINKKRMELSRILKRVFLCTISDNDNRERTISNLKRLSKILQKDQSQNGDKIAAEISKITKMMVDIKIEERMQ